MPAPSEPLGLFHETLPPATSEPDTFVRPEPSAPTTQSETAPLGWVPATWPP
jgi:hypothetical protein